MKMNHRWGLREPLARHVQVWQSSAKAIEGCTRDLSFDGVFVEACGLMLYPGTLLDLITMRRVRGVTWIRRMSAVVARLTEAGIGLMFTTRDAVEITRFTEMLRGDNALLSILRSGSYQTFKQKPGGSAAILALARMRMNGAPVEDCVPDGGYKLASDEDHDHGKTG